MKLTVVGCSPAWPNPGGAQSGYLLEGPGSLLLDCGPGVLARLRERNGRWPGVESIIITHFHLDHWGDLVPWVWGILVGPARDEPRTELWLPPDGLEMLEKLGASLGWPEMFAQAFDIRRYDDDVAFRTAAGFEITPIRLPHYTLRTYGLRVTNGSHAVAYSGDSGPSERLAELARDADLFVCEATLERGELDGRPRGHLSVDEAVEAFHAAGAKRLLLTHRPDELPVGDGWELAHDGLEIKL